MVRRLAPIVVLFILLVGCTKALPEDKAQAVLKDLGPALASMEGAGQGSKDGTIQTICQKHGVETRSLAKYLEENPAATEKLVEFISEAYKVELTKLEGEYKGKLNAIEEEKKANLEKIQTSNEEAKREAEMAAARKAGQAKKKFEAEKATLLQELKKLQTQI